MTAKMYTKEWFQEQGRKGGKASGKSKKRGSKAHYAELGRRSAAARKKK